MTYPKAASERRAERDRIRRELLTRAELQAARSGRSIKCGNWVPPSIPWHAGEDGGCASDGSGCLCECHDPKEADGGR